MKSDGIDWNEVVGEGFWIGIRDALAIFWPYLLIILAVNVAILIYKRKKPPPARRGRR